MLPILIHGDAAFPGQGVVAETLNLHRLSGYTTGGTIHIIANNQIGFTTDTTDSYSTLYASGLARAFKIPIIHVNADDPEACVAAARLAFAYRAKFKRDFLIDLVGYRRYGHNEGDEPAFTQPVMYQKVQAQPTVREKWAKTLESRGVLQAGEADAMLASRMDALQAKLEALDPEKHLRRSDARGGGAGDGGHREDGRAARLASRDERCAADRAGRTFTCTASSNAAAIAGARRFADPKAATIDWATAEELAFASDPRRRHADPADGRGRRARHVQPPPRGAVRLDRRPARTRRFRRSRRRARRSRSATAR